jgi:hypothetical protein
MHIRYVLGLVIGLSLVHSLPARAASPPSVALSEIQWAGSARSTADEWFELANTTGSDIPLGGWFLTGVGVSGSAIVIADGTVLPANGTIVVANYALGNEKTTLNVAPTLVTTSVSISNTALSIVLAQPDGLVVDELQDAGTPDYGSNVTFASMERDLTTLEWHTATTSLGLLDGQLGSPGLIQAVAEPVVEEPVPIEPAPVVEAPIESPVVSEETPVVVDEPIEVVPLEPEILPLVEPVVEPIVEPVTEPVTELIPETTLEPIPEPELAVAPEPVVEPEPEIAPTVEPEPPLVTARLILNEIMSAPTDGNEWVEIFNPEEREVALEGWLLKEGSGKQTSLSGTIPALGYSLVQNPQGKLNNDGDQLQLVAPDGSVVSSLDYGTDTIDAPASGKSLAWDGTSWLITATPSPASANIFPSVVPVVETPEPTSYVPPSTPQDVPAPSAGLPPIANGDSLAETDAPEDLVAYIAAPVVTKTPAAPVVRKAAVTKRAKAATTTVITGTLVALPGVFGSQIAYLDGQEIYFNKAEWPTLSVGDELRLRGTYSMDDGQQRLKISAGTDIEVIGSSAIMPHDSDLAHQPHGSLVSVEGNIVSREGAKISLQTVDGLVTIAADSDTDVHWSAFGAERVRVTGILRRTSSTYAIWPRSSTDIERVEAPSTISATSSPISKDKPWLGMGLFAGSSATLGGWYVRHKVLTKKALTLQTTV